MNSEERRRYYEAMLVKNGKLFRLAFRNDDLKLARDHAQHCADAEGMTVKGVRFVGVVEPQRLGEMIEVVR